MIWVNDFTIMADDTNDLFAAQFFSEDGVHQSHGGSVRQRIRPLWSTRWGSLTGDHVLEIGAVWGRVLRTIAAKERGN